MANLPADSLSSGNCGTTSQQRAARIAYHLTPRALAGMEGLTTSQVAQMIGLTTDGARKLLITLEAAGTTPITYLDGRWVMLPYHLKAAHKPRERAMHCSACRESVQ